MLYIAHMFPDAPTYGIGFSLGAGMMTKYLGEFGCWTESQMNTKGDEQVQNLIALQ